MFANDVTRLGKEAWKPHDSLSFYNSFLVQSMTQGRGSKFRITSFANVPCLLQSLFNNKKLSILACDMAGPGFDFFHWEDPKKAAKNVQCIHTSFYAGTIERNCHQNWIMGDCGKSQPAADDLMAMFCGITRSCPNETLFSHNVCPYLYNSAFSHDFVANNYHNCSSHRMAKNLPVNFKMGYMETRKKLVSKIDLRNGCFLFFA